MKTNNRIATFCICCTNKILNKSPAVLMPFISHRTFGWAPAKINDDWDLKRYHIKNTDISRNKDHRWKENSCTRMILIIIIIPSGRLHRVLWWFMVNGCTFFGLTGKIIIEKMSRPKGYRRKMHWKKGDRREPEVIPWLCGWTGTASIVVAR